ncbi:F420-0--gamma-glutamyl ligase, partial [Candidatus Saccharibacteria bacterium]|nr:F420-0--gamma-glutamyl ligase [Candidatus Saccharibacteria bacterium]
AIDGPTDYTILPYNRHAKLGPKNPGRVAAQLNKALGFPVVIIDASDKGVHVIATSRGVDKRMVTTAFRDNPMGQSDEQTPLCILRPA